MAFLAGLAGGLTSRVLTPDRTNLRVGTVRARRIELVDVTGKVTAFIGTDDQRDTAIVFLDEKMRERAKFGVWSGSYAPKMIMTGADGKERVAFHLSRLDDRPIILLRDHQRTRVYLGFFQNDVPGPKDEDWGIRFYDPHGYENSLAAIGMRRDWNDDKMHGFVFVQGKDGQPWSEPKLR
ncbi:MAG TPA: hypothetical protein VKE70_26190 [Candidatus Solibacter sp.]|nr:hypothetical protein [Candidatus Solibacter sp.]